MDKLKRKKIDALRITLSIVVGDGEPYQLTDTVRIKQGWMGKFDGLRISTGETISSREEFDTDTLIGKAGMLLLTEKDGTNFVGRYLAPEE